MVRFDGQVALVTGSGVGLGRAYALLLASRGAKVVVNDPGRTADGRGANPAAADAVVAEIRAAGGEAVANYDSIAEASGAENAIRAATAAYGRLDILVNNAGILRDAPLATSTLDDLQQVIAVNFLGSLYCTRAALPVMLTQDYGRIVLTTSGSGLFGFATQATYGAAKAAMVGLMNSVALECAGTGITINTVMPSAATRLSLGLVSEDLARMMSPETVAPLVGWLASRDCTASGDCIGAFGGHFAKLRLFKAEGQQFDPHQPITPEMVGARYDAITDMKDAAPFLGTRVTLRKLLEKEGKL